MLAFVLLERPCPPPPPADPALTVTLVEAPLPGGKAEAAARFSIAALGAGWRLPPHRAHLSVTWNGADDEPPPSRLTRFVRLLAALTEGVPAVGVHWPDAGATHDPELVRQAARDGDLASMVMLWTGVSVTVDPDGRRMTFLSLGMTQAGIADLMLTTPRERANEAMALFFDTLAFVIERGEPVADGDTVGRSDDERLRVIYVPSPRDLRERVWRIDVA